MVGGPFGRAPQGSVVEEDGHQRLLQLKGIPLTVAPPAITVTLPSDQEASGRSFDDAELAAGRRGSPLRHADQHQGHDGRPLRAGRGRADRRRARRRLRLRLGRRARRRRRGRPRARRRDHHHLDHRHGRARARSSTRAPSRSSPTPTRSPATSPPQSIAAALSDRTRAIIVTHLFGNPADLAGIREVAAQRRRAGDRGLRAGLPGRHPAGPGRLGRRARRVQPAAGQAHHLRRGRLRHHERRRAGPTQVRVYVNKSWPYGKPNPDHRWLALNYRLTELQGAVALGQLGKLPAGRRPPPGDRRAAGRGARRTSTASRPTVGRARATRTPTGATSCTSTATSCRAARRRSPPSCGRMGIPSAPRYIAKPAFRCGVFAEQKTFGDSRWPFTLARPEAVDYSAERFPGTFALPRHGAGAVAQRALHLRARRVRRRRPAGRGRRGPAGGAA